MVQRNARTVSKKLRGTLCELLRTSRDRGRIEGASRWQFFRRGRLQTRVWLTNRTTKSFRIRCRQWPRRGTQAPSEASGWASETSGWRRHSRLLWTRVSWLWQVSVLFGGDLNPWILFSAQLGTFVIMLGNEVPEVHPENEFLQALPLLWMTS